MNTPDNCMDASLLPEDQGSDYTVYLKSDDIPHLKRLMGKLSDVPLTDNSWCFRTPFLVADKPARIQAVQCFEGERISLTVRARKIKEVPPQEKVECGFIPDDTPKAGQLNTTREVCDLASKFLRTTDRHHGLIVVSGSTNSMKTQLAQGLIHLHMRSKMESWSRGGGRKPHLVTCEDNIEEYFFTAGDARRLNGGTEESARPWAVLHDGLPYVTKVAYPDYTPRLIKTDVPTLSRGVEDALRMTPEMFYAGEIRNPKDWPHLYRLAHSHIVIVTAHASSLLSTFATIESLLEVEDAVDRSELAQVMLGIVHLKGDQIDGTRFILPSSWVRSSRSIAAFAAEGLASITPTYGQEIEKDPTKAPFCLGRRSYAEALLMRKTVEAGDKLKNDIRSRALRWDLEGQ
jgi:hypothetical protein